MCVAVGGCERIGVILYTGFEPISDTIDIFFLSHLPMDKMTTISQTVFSYVFREWNVMYFIKISLKFVPKDPVDK